MVGFAPKLLPLESCSSSPRLGPRFLAWRRVPKARGAILNRPSTHRKGRNADCAERDVCSPVLDEPWPIRKEILEIIALAAATAKLSSLFGCGGKGSRGFRGGGRSIGHRL